MKEVVEEALNGAIHRAEDNLYRAKARFNPNEMDLSKEWGQSGRTCQQILDDYQNYYDELIKAKEWLALV